MNLTVHTPQSAPAEVAQAMRDVEKRYGFVPNLIGVMAGAPALLQAYLQVAELFSRTSLSPVEQQVVLLAASATNQCDYCVAAHSMTAKMHQVPEEVIQALRDEQPLADARLEALRKLTTEIVEQHGWPSEQAIEAFLSVGFEERQLLEVILGVGMKTLSNYTNHLAQTPLDEQFASAAWPAPTKH